MPDTHRQPVGTFEGTPVEEVVLRSDAGAEARLLTWGAVLRDLHVPSRSGSQRVVLGFDRFEDYPGHSPYFGAIPGRFANRIAEGRFSIDGTEYQADRNEKGRTTLHGGSHGFGKRVWSLAAHDDREATFVLVSDDGDMGFPGRATVACTYRLLEPATLVVEFTATVDKPSPVNLAHHSYFNLDGSPSILDHTLMLAADFYTPVDDALIPTGEIARVEGSPYDFRTERPIRHDAQGSPFPYDTNFVLRGPSGTQAPGTLHHAATAHSAGSGVELQVWTTQPGVQFYSSSKLHPGVPGHDGATYEPFGGFCLETQNFPDAPNHAHFPDAILRPGRVYHHVTEYRFAVR